MILALVLNCIFKLNEYTSYPLSRIINRDSFMIKIRKAEDCGYSNLDWLQSKHSFSFGRYYDPDHVQFESLRVINDDKVVAGAGFSAHQHDNMEIISYVLEGELEHKDSIGNGSVIRPGEVQLLSAGTGVTHSEYNHSQKEEVHFLQIWFLPDARGLKPSYEQRSFSEQEKRGKFRLVASKLGRENSVSINQDVDMSVALIDGDEVTTYQAASDRSLWVHVARGKLSMNGHDIKQGDGVAIVNETKLIFDKAVKAEVIIFDMQPISAIY